MGACASKPKVLGDRMRSRRNSTSTARDGNLASFSSGGQPSLKDNRQSLSFSAVPDDKAALSFGAMQNDKEQTTMTRQEDKDITPNTIIVNDNVHHDELSSNDDKDRPNHDRDVHLNSTEDETDETISEVKAEPKYGQNGVVEEQTDEQDEIPNTSSPTIIEVTSPTRQSSPRPYTTQNDVVETVLKPDVSFNSRNDGVKVVETPAEEVLLISPQNDAVDVDDDDTSSSEGSFQLQNVPSTTPNSNNSKNGVVEEPSQKENQNVVVEATETNSTGLHTLISSTPGRNNQSKELVTVDQMSSPVVAVQHAGPTFNQHTASHDHRVVQVANKVETTDDKRGKLVTSSNAMPSTFAF